MKKSAGLPASLWKLYNEDAAGLPRDIYSRRSKLSEADQARVLRKHSGSQAAKRHATRFEGPFGRQPWAGDWLPNRPMRPDEVGSDLHIALGRSLKMHKEGHEMMLPCYATVLEKTARVFGSSAPSGDILAEQALPYDVRREKLRRYYLAKANEKPSSTKRLVGGGAAIVGLGMLPGMFARRKQLSGLQMLLSGGAGAGAGALLGAGAAYGDRKEIRKAQEMLRRGPEGIDNDMIRRIRAHRTAEAAKRTADAATPALIEQRARIERTRMHLADRAAAREAMERQQESADRASILAKLRGHSGSESAARGHFGKSLGELTARELAVVQSTLEKTSEELLPKWFRGSALERRQVLASLREGSIGVNDLVGSANDARALRFWRHKKHAADLTPQQAQQLALMYPPAQYNTWEKHTRAPSKSEKELRYRKLIAGIGVGSGVGFLAGSALGAMMKRKGLTTAELKKLRYLVPLLMAAGAPPVAYVAGKRMYVDRPVTELRRPDSAHSGAQPAHGGLAAGQSEAAGAVSSGRVSPVRPPAPPLFDGLGAGGQSPLALGGRRPPVGSADPGDPYSRYRYVGR